MQSLGIILTDAKAVIAASTKVINWQMWGMLIGGIIWGIMGDKKGRLSVLFGSIILYSVANFITGFVQNVDQYAWARFVAGIGLAGELGAGITLVSELLPKAKSGIGTSMVAGIGLFGAVAAYFTFKITDDWRLCYKIGGWLGVLLLFLRISVSESGMFKHVQQQAVLSRGNFFMFFQNAKTFQKIYSRNFNWLANMVCNWGTGKSTVIGLLKNFMAKIILNQAGLSCMHMQL